jgi:hypothetical protein
MGLQDGPADGGRKRLPRLVRDPLSAMSAGHFRRNHIALCSKAVEWEPKAGAPVLKSPTLVTENLIGSNWELAFSTQPVSADLTAHR